MEIGGLDDAHASMQAMDERDAAFAHAIYDAAVRRWITLGALLTPLTTQPFGEMEARLRGALIGAGAQLIFLDRVPAHAIINHTVEWCKQRIRPGAGGVANAVLRRLTALVLDDMGEKRRRGAWTNQRDELPLSDGSALVFSHAVLPEDDVERLGVATSIPADLLASWLRRESWEVVVELARHGTGTPPTILNARYAKDLSRMSSGSELTAPDSDSSSSALVPHRSVSHVVFDGSRSGLRRLLASRGDLWVQDPAASGAVDSIADRRVGRGLIIDACAGQGTKTRQLAAMFPGATIIATDVDANRRSVLASVFAGNPQVSVVPFKSLREEFIERADLVLLDVPCSNTGVLARRPEAKYRYASSSIESLAALQRQIIADTIPLLSRGAAGGTRGTILYSTCSLEPDEDEAIARWAAQQHSFKLSFERRAMPTGGPGRPAEEYRDGAYSVLLT